MIAGSKSTETGHLHHEYNGVHGDHHHDEVLERCRDDELPDAELGRVLVLGHVAACRVSVDRKVDALFLHTIQCMRHV